MSVLVLALAATSCAGTDSDSQSADGSQTAEPGEELRWEDGVLQPLSDGFPERTINLVSPTPAQEDTAILMRHIQQAAEKLAPVDIRIHDRPDFGNAVTEALAWARDQAGGTDGYYLSVGTAGGVAADLLTTPMMEELDVSYEDHAFLLIEETPWLIVARADAPFDDLEEMAEFARENPGELRNISRPAGSATALGFDYYLSELGIDVEKVVGGSQEEILLALGAGEGDVAITLVGLAGPHIQNGRIKVLACTGNVTPCEGTDPEVPSALTVLGNEGPDPWASQRGLTVLGDTPDAHIEWLTELLGAVTEDEEYIEARSNIPGARIEALNREESQARFDAFWDAAYALLEESGELDPGVTSRG